MSKQGIASIGMKVTVNKTEMNYVQEIGDISQEQPSELDATCSRTPSRRTSRAFRTPSPLRSPTSLTTVPLTLTIAS